MVYHDSYRLLIYVENWFSKFFEGINYHVTAHEFKGGHSDINLTNAANLETTATKREHHLDVEVKITNAESGHKLPTEIPSRRLVLEVTLRSAYDSSEAAWCARYTGKSLPINTGPLSKMSPICF